MNLYQPRLVTDVASEACSGVPDEQREWVEALVRCGIQMYVQAWERQERRLKPLARGAQA